MVKKYGRHEVRSIQVLILLLCVLLFFLPVFFFFRTLSIISSVRYFNRSSPIEEYLSHGNFRNCLSTKREFEQVAVSHYEVSKIFKGIQKTMPFKLNAIFT